MGKIVSKVMPRPQRTPWVQIYLPELVRGMSVVLGRFVKNFFGGGKNIVTIQYPEEKGDFPVRYRGHHRLMKRKDGSVRCTACMMCATVCPANCIHIEAGEAEDPSSRDIQKFPVKFEIDSLVCVVCGFCVEACPCDALRMDSQTFSPPVRSRSAAWMDKRKLMSRGTRSIAFDGGYGAEWRDDPIYREIGQDRAIYRPAQHLKEQKK